MSELREKLSAYHIETMSDAPASRVTTFRTGGNIALLVTVRNEEEMMTALNLTQGMERKIIGNGSNLLVSDRGYEGVVIHPSMDSAEIRVEGNRVYAFAGAMLSKTAVAVAEAGLTGLEFAHGIPGSVGGAVYMNAGAYGGTIDGVLEKSIYWKNGERHELDAADHRYGYRESIYKDEPDRIVMGAVFALDKGDKDAIWTTMRELSQKRRTSQPLEFPSAGSVFKRPVGHFAGKLIEDAGLKGTRIGGAEVSPKHAGFIVNVGGATSNDVYRLIRHIQKVVEERFGVILEREVELLGDFPESEGE
ncbi:MAG: UDP-N-acetylmuramate dehydrogenase [Clostridia bacterium]|nr:UDP-N-acetylmuramate dehydrogenase [Clostridia bacterium]